MYSFHSWEKPRGFKSLKVTQTGMDADLCLEPGTFDCFPAGRGAGQVGGGLAGLCRSFAQGVLGNFCFLPVI